MLGIATRAIVNEAMEPTEEVTTEMTIAAEFSKPMFTKTFTKTPLRPGFGKADAWPGDVLQYHRGMISFKASPHAARMVYTHLGLQPGVQKAVETISTARFFTAFIKN